MKVLVACEYSGRVRDAFLRRGHDAMSCDLLPTDARVHHLHPTADRWKLCSTAYQGIADAMADQWGWLL
jgi:hypothetical protein